MNLTFFLLFILTISNCAYSTTIYGYKNYTAIDIGNINIIFGVPHDGTLKPSNIQDRTQGDIIADSNTRKLADSIRSELSAKLSAQLGFQAVPFIVYNNLHRSKFDANRALGEACENTVDDCHLAYEDYNNMIQNYFMKGFMKGGRFLQGILFDIHGQAHAENWIEVGYVISISDLNNFPVLTPNIKSSISYMASLSPYSYNELIRGNISFGGFLERKFNYTAVPSPRFPAPNGGNYFNGGYTTLLFGSKQTFNYSMNAIQIESPASLRSLANVVNYGKNLSAVIFDYYNFHNLGKLRAMS